MYRRRLGPEARLLVYYAGHGYHDREQNKAYWLPVDASADDPVNWIIADEITAAVRVVPARHVLVVSDSCYSGTLTRGIGESLPPAAERERFLQRMAAGAVLQESLLRYTPLVSSSNTPSEASW